ncbi:Predicted DNA-binding protein with PD1-like DNA-binding motif [Desulfotomaculum arcticum]|uniref:Predicted DNA-binding protein with PD1-like DNA-binding motif n=1 Tax=Desulfotruncus arcticus DSM 17038 TaxID=1121424 RepID=A0A1I2QK93_9FIRM|nr:PPC domain-containing DNA-binding protein [Desulfotruncus arcticus]SFG26011.1 Predicted DNA-binding protein with PD1-like DNA-binding motif [Desulfotomaculum arcticum] [Desulfotruncus arcticus DSM 17038]
MKYRQGTTGRVFVARVDHGEDLLAELKNLADHEKIEAGILYVIGAVKEAALVVGPAECTKPPVPVWRKIDDCREMLGVGTMFRDNGEPVFHLHSSLGKGDTVLTGCIRDDSEVYLVCEVIIVEITGTGAIKTFDAASGFKMLDF